MPMMLFWPFKVIKNYAATRTNALAEVLINMWSWMWPFSAFSVKDVSSPLWL